MGPIVLEADPERREVHWAAHLRLSVIRGFVDAVNEVNSGKKKASDFDGTLLTISTIVGTTAILEAGRKSLDLGGVPFELAYSSDDVHAVPTSMHPAKA